MFRQKLIPARISDHQQGLIFNAQTFEGVLAQNILSLVGLMAHDHGSKELPNVFLIFAPMDFFFESLIDERMTHSVVVR